MAARRKTLQSAGREGANNEAIKVVVRVRPLSQKEKFQTTSGIIHVSEPTNEILLENPKGKGSGRFRTFVFDNVFGPESSQEEVYKHTAVDLIDSSLRGFNSTLLAYGQSGSGKTYTMEGDESSPGIIPQSFSCLFDRIWACKDMKFLITVSHYEVYQEKVRDLLSHDSSQSLKVREAPGIGTYIDGLTSVICHSPVDMLSVMRKGQLGRVTGSTGLNLKSSRSHTIFVINIEGKQYGKSEEEIITSKIVFVDLAGSERQTKSHSSGILLKESQKINMSLSCLGDVISALSREDIFIPYRNSKLTRILQDSFGGKTKTVLIAHVNPCVNHYTEGFSTLTYSSRARGVTNNPVKNENLGASLIPKVHLLTLDKKHCSFHAQRHSFHPSPVSHLCLASASIPSPSASMPRILTSMPNILAFMLNISASLPRISASMPRISASLTSTSTSMSSFSAFMPSISASSPSIYASVPSTSATWPRIRASKPSSSVSESFSVPGNRTSSTRSPKFSSMTPLSQRDRVCFKKSVCEKNARRPTSHIELSRKKGCLSIPSSSKDKYSSELKPVIERDCYAGTSKDTGVRQTQSLWWQRPKRDDTSEESD